MSGEILTTEQMGRAGFPQVSYELLTGGIVALHLGR